LSSYTVIMVDPARTLIGDLEREAAALPGASLFPGAGLDASDRFAGAMGRRPPPGFAAFLSAHDGGILGREIKLYTLAEATQRHKGSERGGGQPGLWPILEHGPRRFALDAEEASTDGEWPVVEVTERGVDRVGTSFLRFLHVLMAELAGAIAGGAQPLALAQERCRRDPGLAEHWIDLAELQQEAGLHQEIDATLAAALRAASPPTPALLLMLGMRLARQSDWTSATRAFEDAMALEPLAARDDDARLDAAALVFVLASDSGDALAMATARRVLGPATAATAAYWRAEALQALAGPSSGADAARHESVAPADLALRIVLALVPEDPDIKKLRDPRATTIFGLRGLRQAREALENGRPEQAVREARAALGQGETATLGVAHALLAEALNALRDRGALEAARKATELNPFLVEGWRELGDAHLEAGDLKGAEAAFRRVVEMDGTYGLGYAKLAQVLLEQGRSLEALESITTAAERGGDPFFLAAIRGDIYAEMERHPEAAEAYDQALRIEPDDHWALHQAAVEHGFAGHGSRASELFEAALRNDREGCHQTLVDYGDYLRRAGRIGDAVKLYRRAVAAVPGDPEWKQTLRDAERELLAAPN
jgi:tetratricopeptide (TPR) repeat protein